MAPRGQERLRPSLRVKEMFVLIFRLSSLCLSRIDNEGSMTTLAEALAAHTQHLTELYARLDGSPQATVCKKLDELHAALVGTIDEQKRTAEGEVKAVEDECEDLQTQLERIAKVLGKRLAQDPESHVGLCVMYTCWEVLRS